MVKNRFFIIVILLVATLSSCKKLFLEERDNILRLGKVKSIGYDYVGIDGILLDISTDVNKPVTGYGHVWSTTNEEPTLQDESINYGDPREFGEYTSIIKGLTPGTTYHIRAFVLLGDDEERYSENVLTITTGQVLNLAIFNITSNRAAASGSLSPEVKELISYGHCWAKDKTPDLNDSKTSFSQLPTEPFKSIMNDVESNSTYFVRAYMIDKRGYINYGKVLKFQTVE